MSIRRIVSVMTATFAAFAALVFSATAAQADPEWAWRTYSSDGCGMGYFVADGDHIGANDWCIDGLSTAVRWETNYGRSDVCYDSNGGQNGVTDCNYDMQETGSIRWNVCLHDSGVSGWINCSGWTPWHSIYDGDIV